MEFKDKLKTYTDRIEAAMDRLLPATDLRPARIHQAMRYSMAAGGKRIRPILVVAANELCGGCHDPLPAAVAIECLHTYSLIHDDLPSIDNGDLRRGIPTCHVEFDEATAVLAGDALLTYAFQLLSRHYAENASLGLRLVSLLSETAGSATLIGGQVEDILGEKRQLNAEDLDFIHLNKTAALIETSLKMGAITGGANDAQIAKLAAYGRCIGLGFQIVDDILDATSDTETLGKDVGSDASLNKTTYVSLHGLDASKKQAAELAAKAENLCDELGADFLKDLAVFLNNRLN